mgnify:FL=1
MIRRQALSRKYALPTTWATADLWLGSMKFATLPQGNGAQLERLNADQIAFMFNRRKAIVFCRPAFDGTNDTKLVVCGHVFTQTLANTLRPINDIVAGVNRCFSVSRYVAGKSGVLLRAPSEDLGRPEGDPFVLDAAHNCVLTYGSRHVLGTPWRPNGCYRTDADECACGYCRAIRSRRLDAIAKAIAGEFEP